MFHQKLIRMLLRILFSTHCVRHARDRLRCLFKTASLVLLVLLGINFYVLANAIIDRGVINGKAGKAAALPKFSDALTLSHSLQIALLMRL